MRDGAEALSYLQRTGAYADRADGNPAVLLLDLKLPKVDGLEVLKTVRETTELRRIPVVMLTSSREEPDLMKAYELGVNAYVVKPVEFRILSPQSPISASSGPCSTNRRRVPCGSSVRATKKKRTHNETVRLARRTVSTIPAPSTGRICQRQRTSVSCSSRTAGMMPNWPSWRWSAAATPCRRSWSTTTPGWSKRYSDAASI